MVDDNFELRRAESLYDNLLDLITHRKLHGKSIKNYIIQYREYIDQVLLIQDDKRPLLLHIAVKLDNEDDIEALMREAELTGLLKTMLLAQDSLGETALLLAFLGPSPAAIRVILAKVLSSDGLMFEVLTKADTRGRAPIKHIICGAHTIAFQEMVEAARGQGVAKAIAEFKDNIGAGILEMVKNVKDTNFKNMVSNWLKDPYKFVFNTSAPVLPTNPAPLPTPVPLPAQVLDSLPTCKLISKTLSCESSMSELEVNLAEGYAIEGGIKISIPNYIENVKGSRNNNKHTLIGNANVNELEGGAGDDFFEAGDGLDILRGGPGSDTVSYKNSQSGVIVMVPTGETHFEGWVDKLYDIENLDGSNYGDILVGAGDKENRLNGGSGDDILKSSHNDVLTGGHGTDTFVIMPNTYSVTITDFDISCEKLDLSQYDSIQHDNFKILDGGAASIISFTDERNKEVKITMQKLQRSDFLPNNFIFNAKFKFSESSWYIQKVTQDHSILYPSILIGATLVGTKLPTTLFKGGVIGLLIGTAACIKYDDMADYVIKLIGDANPDDL